MATLPPRPPPPAPGPAPAPTPAARARPPPVPSAQLGQVPPPGPPGAGSAHRDAAPPGLSSQAAPGKPPRWDPPPRVRPPGSLCVRLASPVGSGPMTSVEPTLCPETRALARPGSVTQDAPPPSTLRKAASLTPGLGRGLGPEARFLCHVFPSPRGLVGRRMRVCVCAHVRFVCVCACALCVYVRLCVSVCACMGRCAVRASMRAHLSRANMCACPCTHLRVCMLRVSLTAGDDQAWSLFLWAGVSRPLWAERRCLRVPTSGTW